MAAQNRFCFILVTVALERRMAASTSSGSLRISTTSAVSMATPVPAPIAMPRSACASAGQADGDACALRLRGGVQQVRRRHRLAAGEAAGLAQGEHAYLAAS